MSKFPAITFEKLERGSDYPTPYRAHIVGAGCDHHGEAETPAKALVCAATHWLEKEGAADAAGVGRLERLVERAEELIGHSRAHIEVFVQGNSGSTGFSGGAHVLQLAGVRGTSTQSVEEAFTSWLRLARKRIESATS